MTEPDLFTHAEPQPSFTIHVVPPKYPAKLTPWRRCKHPPQFRLFLDMEAVRAPNGGIKGYDMIGQICFGCGKPLEGSHVSTIFHTLSDMMGEYWAFQPANTARIRYLSDRWTRVAMCLFGPEGWTGRYEHVARMIDPELTMRLTETVIGGDRLAHLTFGDPQNPEDVPPGRWSLTKIIKSKARGQQ